MTLARTSRFAGCTPYALADTETTFKAQTTARAANLVNVFIFYVSLRVSRFGAPLCGATFRELFYPLLNGQKASPARMRFMGHNSSFCHTANRVRESFVIFTKFTQVIELQISYCLHICECVSEELQKYLSPNERDRGRRKQFRFGEEP